MPFKDAFYCCPSDTASTSDSSCSLPFGHSLSLLLLLWGGIGPHQLMNRSSSSSSFEIDGERMRGHVDQSSRGSGSGRGFFAFRTLLNKLSDNRRIDRWVPTGNCVLKQSISGQIFE